MHLCACAALPTQPLAAARGFWCAELLTLTTCVINVVMGAQSPKKPVPVYLRGIPAEIVREAKAQAARRGVTLAGFVAETLGRALYASESRLQADPPQQGEGLDAELRWYEKHREQLVQKYAGQFIAIVNQRVVDHDVAFEALAERVFKLRGIRDTFMPEVRARTKTLHVRSPRVARRS